MQGILIGYFPKRTAKTPTWLKNPIVEEICSVSCCISEDPDNWIEKWRHNEMGMYESPEAAWSVVPDLDREKFELYAYRMLPIEFNDGAPAPFNVPLFDLTPLDVTFTQLGYDVVSNSTGNWFECSPLSCNHMADSVDVNRHCLLDSVERAIELAKRCEAEGCEPGPYYLLEVFRQGPKTTYDRN